MPIPGDDTQVMYVWFGAFVNYISTLGWPGRTSPQPSPYKGEGENLYEKFWQDGYTVQVAGKDMVKFQSVMWQGMLMSAGMSPTDTIIYHGFITGEGGIKMSKSIGNVISPNEIAKNMAQMHCVIFYFARFLLLKTAHLRWRGLKMRIILVLQMAWGI